MNKYTIILIFLLIIIIIYLKYIKNKNKFEHLTKNDESLISLLSYKYFGLNDNKIEIRKKDGTPLGINIDNGILNYGDKFTLDTNENTSMCNNYNLDNGEIKQDNVIIQDNKLIFDEYIYENNILSNNDSSLIIDNNNNKITIGNFIYDEENKFQLNDVLFNIDSNNNIIFDEYIYDPANYLKTNKNNFAIDLKNNIIATPNYKLDAKNNILYGNNNFIIDKNNIKCGLYDSNKIIVGSEEYIIGDNLTDKNNNIVINSDGKTYYYITKIILSKFINPTVTTSNSESNSAFYPTSLCSSVTTYLWSNKFLTSRYPLTIAGLRFTDTNNNYILPVNYFTTSINMTETPVAITSENLYNNFTPTDATLKTTQYPQIGLSINNVNPTDYAYVFTFKEPKIVKSVQIKNITKPGQFYLNYSNLYVYGFDSLNPNQEKLIKVISLNNFEPNPHYTIPTNFFINILPTVVQADPMIVNIQ